MALREGAALGILAGKPDRVAVEQDRAEGQRFAGRPVDAFARFDHLAPRLEEAADRLVGLEIGGNLGQLLADFLQRLHRYGGLAAPLFVLVVGGAQARPGAVQPVGLVGLVLLADFPFRFEMGAPVGLHLLVLAFREQALGDQPVGIDLPRRPLGADLAVHDRLGECRLVALVVAEAAVAEHVDDHRLVERHAEFGGHLGGVDHSLRIVAVDVEDRRLDHLGHIRRIGRRARETRIGGEADLVVDDEVQRAGDAVAAQAGQAEDFGDHALAGERRIAVQQQRQHLGAFLQRHDFAARAAGELVLLGARLAHHHRIDDFQMRRDWRSATDAPCCRRTRGPTTRRDGTSRRPNLRRRQARRSRP